MGAESAMRDSVAPVARTGAAVAATAGMPPIAVARAVIAGRLLLLAFPWISPVGQASFPGCVGGTATRGRIVRAARKRRGADEHQCDAGGGLAGAQHGGV